MCIYIYIYVYIYIYIYTAQPSNHSCYWNVLINWEWGGTLEHPGLINIVIKGGVNTFWGQRETHNFAAFFFFKLCLKPHLTHSTAMNVVCRNSFPNFSNFPQNFTQLGKIPRGVQFRKSCRSRKKNQQQQQQSEITWKLLEPVRSISKIEKRKAFALSLWYEQCLNNSFKRLYTDEGLLVLVEKSSFSESKEFWCEFHIGEEGYQ